MLTEFLAVFSLIGFACSNAFEVAVMSVTGREAKELMNKVYRYPIPHNLDSYVRDAHETWKKHPTPMLMTILIFNTAFSMLFCVTGIKQLRYSILAPWIVGGILFVFGELLPKVLARRFPKAVASVLMIPFYALFQLTQGVFDPLFHLIDRLTLWRLPHGLRYPMSGAQVKRILEDVELSSDLKPRSRLVLWAMLDFSSRRVKQAMRSRDKIFYVDLKEPLDSLMDRICKSGYSRVPVSQGANVQSIYGVLYAKDLLFTQATSGLINLQDIVRDFPLVHEEEKLGVLLSRFRSEGIHLALVKNSQGQVVGLISLEDILEELVGEIHDEFYPKKRV